MLRKELGTRIRGVETDWGRTATDISALRNILKDWPGSETTLQQLLAVEASADHRAALESSRQQLEWALARYRQTTEPIDHDPLADLEAEAQVVAGIAHEAIMPLRRISESTAVVYSALVTLPPDLEALTRLIRDGSWM